jgi:hypothetical protein
MSTLKTATSNMVNPSRVDFLFDVRTELNENRVAYFVDLIKNDAPVKKIVLDQNGKGIDGRHRNEAYIRCQVKLIEVEIKFFKSDEERLQFALLSNTGGPLPPNNEDIQFVIKQLFVKGNSPKAIVELLTFRNQLDRKYVSEQLRTVQANLKKAVLQKALREMVDKDLSISEVARIYGVSIEDLSAHISRRSGAKASDKGTLDSVLIASNKNRGNYCRSVTQKLAHVIELMNRGDISDEQAEDILNKVGGVNQTLFESLKKIMDRFTHHIEVYRGSAKGTIEVPAVKPPLKQNLVKRSV